jgi:hypothetical protein
LPVKVKKKKNTKSARGKRKNLHSRVNRKKPPVRKISRKSRKSTRGSGKRRSGKVVYKTTTVVEVMPQSSQTELEEGSVLGAPPLNIPPPDEESSNLIGSDYRMTETTVTEREVETKSVPIDIPEEAVPIDIPEEPPSEYHKRQSKYEDQTSENDASYSQADS